MWLYIQNGCVLATSSSDMTGNSGWFFFEDAVVPTELTNSDGVAIYKIVEGLVVARTEEEIAADTPEPEVPEETLSNEEIAEIMADHEYRICLMELGVSEEDLA